MIKHFTNIKLLTLTAIATIFTACEQTTPTTDVTMPTMQTIECEAGDTPAITFEAEQTWHISSDAIWCNFFTPTGEVFDLSGTAGKHTITLNITSEVLKKEATTAHITMRMGGQEAIIATVVRAADRPTFTHYDAEGNECDAIALGYDEYITFGIKANFRFAATDIPACVAIEDGAIAGAANERVTSGARIVANGDIEREPFGEEAGYVITFANETGDIAFDIPVIFNGMSDRHISIIGATAKNFGWEVSLDGDTFRLMDEVTGEYTTYNEALQYNIIAKDGIYEVLCFERVNNCGLPYYTAADWMHFDKSTGTLSVDATTKIRTGAVLALPAGIYNDIKGDIKSAIFEIDYASGVGIETLRNDFLKYIVVEFTQQPFDERDPYEGFYIYHSLTIVEIFAEEYNNAAVKAEYGVEEAYICPFPVVVDGKTPGLIIDPRIEGWTTEVFETGKATVEFTYKGRKLDQKEGEYATEENKDERMAVRLIGPKDGFNEEVYALFLLDGEPRKLLVVTPPAQ